MKQNFLILLLYFFSFFAKAIEPYDSNVDLPYLPHGWLRDENKIYLEKFIKQLNPKIVIEVGTWLGLSAMLMADILADGSKLYAVDTFKGSGADTAGIPFLPQLYQQFLSNVKHRGLTHKIIPIKQTSWDAAKTLDVKAQLIYIDAAHDYENVYGDIIAWYKHLDVGGIICGDDYGWEGLTEAVKKAANDLNEPLNVYGAFWYFNPKK